MCTLKQGMYLRVHLQAGYIGGEGEEDEVWQNVIAEQSYGEKTHENSVRMTDTQGPLFMEIYLLAHEKMQLEKDQYLRTLQQLG